VDVTPAAEKRVTKIGLISDIHGDPLSLELAWSHLTILGAHRILCAGDIVGYGAHPDRAAKFLSDRRIDAIRGNHDRWALERGLGVRCEYGGAAPSAATLAFLGTLPRHRRLECSGKTVVVVHGSPASDMEYVLSRTHGPDVLDALLKELDADLLVVGHTHAPMWHRGMDGLVVNPGSVISVPVVRTSRTFAMVDLDAMDVRFFDVESGRPLDVPKWKCSRHGAIRVRMSPSPSS
jgi:putative phosphoesterase